MQLRSLRNWCFSWSLPVLTLSRSAWSLVQCFCSETLLPRSPGRQEKPAAAFGCLLPATSPLALWLPIPPHAGFPSNPILRVPLCGAPLCQCSLHKSHSMNSYNHSIPRAPPGEQPVCLCHCLERLCLLSFEPPLPKLLSHIAAASSRKPSWLKLTRRGSPTDG